MLEAASSTLGNIFGCPCVAGVIPITLIMIFVGVLGGLLVGALPGLSGIVGLAIILPFTFDMPIQFALAIMIALLAVTSTGDTVTSVLFGVPGTAGSQATIMDGHPMAKKG